MINRTFIIRPPILFSPVQVHVSPSIPPVECVRCPILLNSSSVSCLSSELYPMNDVALSSPISPLKVECKTSKRPPGIHSYFSVMLIFPPGPMGPGLVSASLSMFRPKRRASLRLRERQLAEALDEESDQERCECKKCRRRAFHLSPPR